MGKELGEIRQTEREGVIFLIYRNGKVLLEKRTTPDKVAYGYTIIPGGKIDRSQGESAEKAAEREILEECGVGVKNLIPLDTFLHVTMSNMLYRTTAFLVTDYDGEIKNIEGKSEQIWVDIDRADKVLHFADSRYIVRLAKDYLSL